MSPVTIPPKPAEAFDHGDHRRYRRGCRCVECKRGAAAERNRQRLLTHTGRGATRTTARTAPHIRRLRAAGMADVDIRAAAGINSMTLTRAASADGAIFFTSEQRILAVPVPRQHAGHHNRTHVDATGTWRRLQALAAAGWTAEAIAPHYGVHPSNIRAVRRQKNPTTTIGFAEKTRKVFRDLVGKEPEAYGVEPAAAKRVRNQARRNGWHPAGVWDDIDNPAEQPQYGEWTPRELAIVEDAGELIRQGLSREAIAGRLGISWNTVTKAHSRHGLPLPAVAA